MADWFAEMSLETAKRGKSRSFRREWKEVAPFWAGPADASDMGDEVQIRLTTHGGLACLWFDGWPLLPKEGLAWRLNMAIKSSFDRVFAGLAILLLSPFWIVLYLTIKLTSRGPVFFCQERVGYRNKIFKVWKFRTMYIDKCDLSGVSQVRRDDDRITPIGRLLRRTSLDELPQLLNVLRGEMSLVGPRPQVSGQIASGLPYKLLVEYYDSRHHVKPGITGWAQVNGYRGPTDDRQMAIARIEHDLAYVQNLSIWLDIKILFLTVVREFVTGSGH